MSTPTLTERCALAEAWHEDARQTLDFLDPLVRQNTQGVRLIAPWDHFVRGIRGHFAEEEEVLFPALRAVDGGEPPPDGPWQDMLAELERELDEVRTIADALRNAARDAGELERPLLDLLDALEAHAEEEALRLHPAALAALSPEAAAPPTPSAPAPAPASRPDRVGILRRTARRLREMVRG
jgi:hypothetical protein